MSCAPTNYSWVTDLPSGSKLLIYMKPLPNGISLNLFIASGLTSLYKTVMLHPVNHLSFFFRNGSSVRSFKELAFCKLLQDRRTCHINAEQKRRCNIKNGFDMLHSLIPQLNQNPTAKVNHSRIIVT